MTVVMERIKSSSIRVSISGITWELTFKSAMPQIIKAIIVFFMLYKIRFILDPGFGKGLNPKGHSDISAGFSFEQVILVVSPE